MSRACGFSVANLTFSWVVCGLSIEIKILFWRPRCFSQVQSKRDGVTQKQYCFCKTNIILREGFAFLMIFKCVVYLNINWLSSFSRFISFSIFSLTTRVAYLIDLFCSFVLLSLSAHRLLTRLVFSTGYRYRSNLDFWNLFG